MTCAVRHRAKAAAFPSEDLVRRCGIRAVAGACHLARYAVEAGP